MPYALTVDTNGDIYVAERGNPIVRKIDVALKATYHQKRTVVPATSSV